MKQNFSSQNAFSEKNWMLIVFSAFIFSTGIILLVISVVFIESFGWWSLAFGSSGLTSMYFAYKAVKTNEPAWILFDLILPK